MGRRAEGHKLRWKRGWAYVRFTHEQTPYCIALGTRDPGEAAARAAYEHAAVVSGRRRRLTAIGGSLLPLDALIAEWIASLTSTLDPTTCTTLETYGRHFLRFFGELSRMTAPGCVDYGKARLRKCLRGTVLKELSYLRQFLAWCVEQGVLTEAPVVALPQKKATGVRSGKMRAAPVEITEAQAYDIIAALPEWTKRIDGRRWPVRARYVVAWETGLRPATLAGVSVPEHYTRGATELYIEETIDKNRFKRSVPLTDAARAALDAVLPQSGLVFGHHRLDRSIKAAARVVLPPHLAKRFAQYDFRHGRGTDLIDAGAPLTGVAFLFGHLRVTTTNRYVKPSRRAAESALEIRGQFPARARTMLPPPERKSS